MSLVKDQQTEVTYWLDDSGAAAADASTICQK